MSTSVAEFRNQYRSEQIGHRYSGRLHLAFTSLTGLAVFVLSLMNLQGVAPLEWLTVPVVFLYANVVEYVAHRFPFHRPFRGLRIIYFRHTKQHHRFFTDDAMQFDSSKDFKAVLFPPALIVFFLVGFGLPMWLLLSVVASENVAWLSVATAIGYYLNYEWLHFAYHCAPDSTIGRLPGVQYLRRLHRQHHNPRLMSSHNFNITYPIGDVLFGTFYRGN